MAQRPWRPRTHQLSTHLGPKMTPSRNLAPTLLPRPWTMETSLSRTGLIGITGAGQVAPQILASPQNTEVVLPTGHRPSCPAQGLSHYCGL